MADDKSERRKSILLAVMKAFHHLVKVKAVHDLVKVRTVSYEIQIRLKEVLDCRLDRINDNFYYRGNIWNDAEELIISLLHPFGYPRGFPDYRGRNRIEQNFEVVAIFR